MATQAELQTRLTEAEAAQHALAMGQSVAVVVDQNGERIEFTPASAFRLASYIEGLKRQLGTSTLGPMKVWL